MNNKPAPAVVLGTDHPHVYGLARLAQEAPATELAGVWAHTAEQREQAAERTGVPTFENLDDALALKPAIVMIGAVPGERAQLAIRALEQGAAALIDKPLALTHDDLKQLQAACEKYGKPVMPYYPFRAYPLVLAAKKLLEDGAIGRLVRIFAAGPHKLNAPTRPDWHWTRQGNGGALIDIASHHADLCCWIAGQAPNQIIATHGNLTQPDHPEFQDFAQAMLRFPDGVFGHIEVDWLNPTSMKNFGDTRFWFQGATGKIELRLGDDMSGHLWNDEVAAQPIQPLDSDAHQWGIKLVQDMVTGQPTDIPQEQVWLASKVTLVAFDSARQNGKPLAM